MMSQTRNTRGRENSTQPHLVFTNDELLIEILIRLPILYIHPFTTVSKQWLQILTSTHFTNRHRKIANLDPPAGIFANRLRTLFECDFVSLDSRLNLKNPLWITHLVPLKKLIIGAFRLAFDPRKLIHYKVVQAGGKSGETWIHIYSLETGNWSFCRDRFSYFSFDHFESAIYWNDAFHWLEGLNTELKHCKLNIEDHDHPILTSLEIPHGLHRGRNFLESFGGPSNDPILLLIEIPHTLHIEGKFFESCGCLLLVCRDDIGFTEFTIYEMMKGSFVWSIRYIVNIKRIMNPLPKGWSIRTSVWSICLGEREEDAFVIFDIGSNQMDDDDDAVVFIPPFEVDPNLYEFILSLASV
ncbi:lysophospholipid acyltransferase 1-like protein [Tanacetum coccineum]|uniref:Lysophospholipid acyltransferase 1-like protein n=1 Tax=Tanacetum coccineum TaxID=301880 RepID=A0ABQ5CCB8_9ASTR